MPAATFQHARPRSLRRLVRGKSNRDIAAELAIGEETVKTHVAHVLAKLDVENRAQAIVEALRRGLITLDSDHERQPRRRQRGQPRGHLPRVHSGPGRQVVHGHPSYLGQQGEQAEVDGVRSGHTTERYPAGVAADDVRSRASNETLGRSVTSPRDATNRFRAEESS